MAMRDSSLDDDFDGGLPPRPDSSVPATAVIDAHGVVTGWSSEAERLLGYGHDEVVGQPASRLLGSDAARSTEWFLAMPFGWGGRSVLRRRDGRHLDVSVRVYPSLDGHGRPQRLIVVSPMDRRHWGAVDSVVEEAFDQAILPMAIFDNELRTLRTSRGMQREAGRTEEQMRGRRPSEFLAGSAGEAVEEGVRHVLASGESHDLHLRIRSRVAPAPRTWTITLSPLADPLRRSPRVQLTAVDTTEQHVARERLALLNEVSTRVGSTLDVSRTAQEMADVVVGNLADFATVDLLDPLFRGVEPQPGDPGVALRRAAQQSVLPGMPESVIATGELDHYPLDSPPTRSLVTGRASLHGTVDRAIDVWAAGDPGRAEMLRRHGIHSVMVIPLRARGITLGVAVLARHRRPDPFDEDDLQVAEEIGARAAVAVDNARRYTRERATALALQRSLLPQRLGRQEAVEVASRYLPAGSGAGVGGDWFDVIPLSGARVALVAGDVVGHGLRASATMGRLRTAVRTLADVDLPPDELLVHLDDLVVHLAGEEVGEDDSENVVTDLVATCLYLVYDPVSRLCTAASAGHPPPVLTTPDGTAQFVDLPPGPPLGLGGLPFETVECALDPDSLLVLYTNGLIATEDRDVDTGMAALRRALTRPDRSLESVCENLVALVPDPPDDDVALVVARTKVLDASQVVTWDVPAEPAAVAGIRAEVTRRLAEWGMEDITYTVELVVSELVTNAVRYGTPPIGLRVIHNSTLIVEVSDGSGTAPHLRRARVFDEGGRGLMLVAQVTERWGTRHTQEGKTIWAEVALAEP
ncbi:SpoIIE family protein phosphatase [Actinacidiphila glaucinigra]|uniref:SpoIIE family protein phosphatase n=1 Tax=Actinacidiphila glaucinigra TaxID=235986 RepID=UPI0035E2C8D7